MKKKPINRNGVTLSELARHYGLEKAAVRSALEAAGIKWSPGPNRSHLYDSTTAHMVLKDKQDIMSRIREQRLGMITAQRELAEQRRDDYNETHIPLEAHDFFWKHMSAAWWRFVESLELPFPKEVEAGHNLVFEQIAAWRQMGMPKDRIAREELELERARAALRKAIKDGVMRDNWMEVPLEVREAICVRKLNEDDEQK